MSSTGTRTIRRIFADRKFDPRAVGTGIVVLLLACVLGFLLLGQSSKQADNVAAPVANLCREGGDTGAKLATSGACAAAGDVSTGVGPYESAASPAVRGARGLPGAAGQPGTGTPGQPGAPGQTGIPGQPGPAGTGGVAGEPGAAGAPGDSVEGPEGAQGEPGEAVTGPQGPAGETVVGPEGPAGPAGPIGPAGESIVGPQGPAGENGAPAAQQTFATDDGRIFSCARTGGTDDSPMYRCVEQAPEAVPTP